MACKTSYELHHNFPRLAEETGFAFNTHRPRIHIDWNKIRLIDIDSLTRDRKFALLEQHVNDILDCVLESEFDVRILDEGVVKLFRLAQLAVEYQQFCRHYLDRSVFVLRQELDTLAQELANTKKDLHEKEDELRKTRRKGKPQYKPLLPYGNDNIAAMILKTLTNKADIFPSTASGEVPQYNKCRFCDKVFLNQLYLKSHISRRHANLIDEPPERDVKETEVTQVNTIGNENIKLNEEINQLKLKIKEMEILITNNNKVLIDSEVIKGNERKNDKSKEMRDVGVYANNDDVLKKLEEWKKTEQANHTKEIDLLRNQIFETLNSFKVKEVEKPDESEKTIIAQLHKTIKDQGAEILSLQQALTETKMKSDNDDMERKTVIEEQMLHWVRRDEAQSKQYEMLVHKLNEVAKEARESRAAAEAERQRAGQLEALLKERLRQTHTGGSSDGGSVSNVQEESDDTDPLDEPKKITSPNSAVKHNSLEQLHRKAQELLNMDSSSTSDGSSSERFVDNKTATNTLRDKSASKAHMKKYLNQNEDKTPPSKKTNTEINKSKSFSSKKTNDKRIVAQKQKKTKKEPSHQKEQAKSSPHLIMKQQNGPILTPGSPLKVVRAKITEEVNSRLVQAGVDPLKSRLSQNVFQKQKAQLQQQLEVKTKKYPAYEQVRYTIMAYLDSDASSKKGDVTSENNMAAPNALTKAFSLSSMISNVKSKALSLVKNKEVKSKSEHKSSKSEFAKKALRLLKTPPESPVVSNVHHSSPPVSDDDEIFDKKIDYTAATEDKNVKPRLIKRKTNLPTQAHLESDSDDSPPNTNPSIPRRPVRSIDNLIRSPARRPSSATTDYGNTVLKYTSPSNDDHLIRTQSATDILEFRGEDREINKKEQVTQSNHDIQQLLEIHKAAKTSPKQTKGVLKNASSTSSLNKKKVLFDMDAIQMKSVSASPSQSITEKSDDKYELGLINIGDDEWDISSIENEPIKSDTKIRVNVTQSPKIAELKQTIEAQLARRSETPSTALFGGVDVLKGPMTKSSNIGGSNTSLGSSILDESDSAKVLSHKHISVVKPKHNAERDDSELEISDFSVDGVTNKNEKYSF
ncbi:cilium assembly protein DZIP1L [Leguminivora glycinivorella]|uniref:cilium assembly protein DZIP1L n=1 Tax=Leguminivora glycinivorella TaxID=1035111 RepID=UPI00200E27A7|nr:cilium assembly protein DZIP1L [Leguminivora glycinivorella]